MNRAELHHLFSDRLEGIRPGHPVRVAIDGVDAAGKTTLADELAPLLRRRGRKVIRASIDRFHRSRAERYRRGPDSPEGYYHDSFDYDALITGLLDPLGPGGSRRYRDAVFDFRSDRSRSEEWKVADPEAILLFDGVFLLRPEIRDRWDFTIFLEVGFDVTVARAQDRDRELFGSPEEVKARYEKRYVPGQRLYLGECRPQDRAHLVIEMSDPEEPRVLADLGR